LLIGLSSLPTDNPSRISEINRDEKEPSGILRPVPDAVRVIAWKAQTRLCQRYRRLMAKGKPRQVVVTAIAGELAGFVWAIA
jgi:hypothetical protein